MSATMCKQSEVCYVVGEASHFIKSRLEAMDVDQKDDEIPKRNFRLCDMLLRKGFLPSR